MIGKKLRVFLLIGSNDELEYINYPYIQHAQYEHGDLKRDINSDILSL